MLPNANGLSMSVARFRCMLAMRSTLGKSHIRCEGLVPDQTRRGGQNKFAVCDVLLRLMYLLKWIDFLRCSSHRVITTYMMSIIML